MLSIIRAWKDQKGQLSTSGRDRAPLSDRSSGTVELTDDQLETVGGSRMSGCACFGGENCASLGVAEVATLQ